MVIFFRQIISSILQLLQQHIQAISKACELMGVEHAVICPGSRSAPLVFAFTQSRIRCYSVTDERSAGYMALGMAQQLGTPVVLICTSGTAVLNFYPAVAEAFYQKIPLVVISADRPPELLNQQDGQMIMQNNVFGSHVHKSAQIPCYSEGNENKKETGAIMGAAIETAIRLKGPVHINVPLREPLYPKSQKRKSGSAQSIHVKAIEPERSRTILPENLKKAWSTSARKLLLVGQLPPDEELFTALRNLQAEEDVVVLCDVLSNKHQTCTAPNFDLILSQATSRLARDLEPDLLISIGGPVLSKALKGWLQCQKPGYHFRIQPEPEGVDTYRNVTELIQAKASDMLNLLCGGSKAQKNLAYRNLWLEQQARAAAMLKKFLSETTFSELHATDTILKSLPFVCNLQIANSSLVRYVSYLGALGPGWRVNSNRGTSGIDGCTSTAVGSAMVNNRPTILLTGDLGFLYDRNALWNPYVPDNLRIIVINNHGGGIFTLIDGPEHHPEVLSFFTTPHEQSIKNTVLDNGMEYYFCDSGHGLTKQLARLLVPGKGAGVLEISMDMKANAKVFRKFKRLRLGS